MTFPDYVRESSFFSPKVMEWLERRGAAIIGGDIPTFDDSCNPAGVNYQLFKPGCLLLAPMINLRQIANWQETILIALPLPVQGVSSTPSRALAIDQNICS
jgi:kynurenine formamidase